MKNDFYSRKFILASTSLLISALALFTGKIDGGTWVAAVTLILGLYKTANVLEKNKNGPV